MRSITIKKARFHTELTAYVTTNNFGDQLIEVVFEEINGTKHTYTENFPENNWLSDSEIKERFKDVRYCYEHGQLEMK